MNFWGLCAVLHSVVYVGPIAVLVCLISDIRLPGINQLRQAQQPLYSSLTLHPHTCMSGLDLDPWLASMLRSELN